MKINLRKKMIGIIGDVVIDKYKYYKAIRLSPEGPAPIVKSLSNSLAIGGAGNVAISLSNLGLDVDLYFLQSFTERDESTSFIKSEAKKHNIKLNPVLSNLKNTIPIKIRYYVDGKQFMREDLEENNFEKNYISKEYLDEIINKYHFIVVSDYQKGLINTKSMRNIIFCCKKYNIPIFIDTKNKNLESIENSYCLKINENEFNSLFLNHKINFDDSIEIISKKLTLARKSVKVINLILTLGARGSFLANSQIVRNIKPDSVDVVDITGAGDAFLAGLIYSFSERYSANDCNYTHSLIQPEDLIFLIVLQLP